MESSFVVPSGDTRKHSIWLSNLDLLLAPSSHTPTITLFRHNGDPNFFSVEILKAALAKALLHFYPLAGRVAVGEDGRLEIQCTGEGVLFVVARSTCTLDVLSDFTPSKEMRQLFVPSSDGNDHMCIMLQVSCFHCTLVFIPTLLECACMCVGDVLRLRWSVLGHRHAPRRHGWRQRAPFHQHMVRHSPRS